MPLNLNNLKTFAIETRRKLMRLVADKISFVLAAESSARRSSPESVQQLEKAISAHGRNHVIEETAYQWFNRFCALRFMDANHYTAVGVVSPADGASRPEILAEAVSGNFDPDLDARKKQRVLALLASEIPSNDRFNDAYRILFIASCNAWSDIMPFLFEKIDDYTELLGSLRRTDGERRFLYAVYGRTGAVSEENEDLYWRLRDQLCLVFESLCPAERCIWQAVDGRS